MNSGMLAAGCCPSESIVSAWVKPSAAASLMPCSTAAPFPPFSGRTITRSAGSLATSSCSFCAVPSVLPSTTTQTGSHCASASRTVSQTLGPGL